MRGLIVVWMCLGLVGVAGAEDDMPNEIVLTPVAAEAAAPDDGSEAGSEADAAPAEAADDGTPKLPEPLSDEEVALIVEDEVDAIIFHWQNLSKNANVNLQTGQVNRSMNFSAILSLPDDTRVAGVGSQMFFVTATNEEGQEVLPNRMDIAAAFGGGPEGGHMPRTSYYPPQRDTNQPGPYRSVSGNIQNMDHDAKSFQKLVGYIPVRIAAQTVSVDVPYEKTEDFADLVADLNVMVHNVRDSGSYHEAMVYFSRDGQDPNQGFNMNAEPSVTHVEILDGMGEPMTSYSNSFSTTSFTHKGQRQYVYYQQQRVRKGSGQTPTTIRVHVALRVQEAPVMFEFEDVPLP